MSYERPWNGPHGGGGGRRRHKGGDEFDYDKRGGGAVWETPEQRLRSTIIKLGEVDADQELARVAQQIREEGESNIPAVAEGFRIGVTEQPFKIPHYAALLRMLYDEPNPSLGKQVLDDFWKGFQAFLDKLAWRETRLCVHFFAHLTLASVISPSSMFALLQSFVAVLDEFGVSQGRGKKAALCAAEGLMRAGPALVEDSSTNVNEIISAIQTYVDSVPASKRLVQPLVRLHTDSDSENAAELLDAALAALSALSASDPPFAETSAVFLQPYLTLPPFTADLFQLPSVLVPPEVIELDGMATEEGEDAPVKKEEWPEYYVRLFENEVTPDATTPAGYAIRADLRDIIDIFEVNRKECARILLEYPKWVHVGTFKPRAGAPAPETNGGEVKPSGKEWQLESTIIETILGSAFVLPEPSFKSLYYIALIVELAKLSPQTVGPAVGKSIRRLYAALAEGLDVEIGRRFAEWFSVHMSNFGFQWVWKEWIPDLQLTLEHPKRLFHRRALEFEIRLAYYDRIMKSLPPPFQDPENGTMADQAPGPDFEYDDPSRPHYDAAQSVLNLLRGRSKAEEVISHLNQLRNQLADRADTEDVNVDSVIRSVAVQSLLHIGSRSFSHFLNAIERYLPILRHLAQPGGGASSSHADTKADILTAAAVFWKRSRQMIGIVFDKLMQYQIVDPTDVVIWTFHHGGGAVGKDELGRDRQGRPCVGAYEWDLLKAAIDKANGRVLVAKRKVTQLRKEEDDTRARENAGVGMEVDADAKPVDVTPVVESPALVSALKAHTSLIREQKAALSAALDGFVSLLSSTSDRSTSSASKVITEDAWNDRAGWNDDDWDAWETWGWYRHFCRTYAAYLRNYSTTLSTIGFAKIEGSKAEDAVLLQKIWNIAIGMEA
ncbi:hypothetical protein PUNSTDRAFT_43188 [Punctularia strigosozonata HHB-11173 SS5]|uniref:uncharacterized protein n=1 Tax=Punctularia strigosozonata (strain HHB-11173) TaxID=741275 RepID=UPI00044167C6|nr:uncharacterized protein PUNSTDRAFT_43188 [Punctularia strigosozonata HHB-11173 SS5]EIN10194.1 hypothetical protein PUNSTDRAFT_43188 [Punctularia strigosozonata HHB-11173 SS5]